VALQLVAERGFAHITVEDIAAAADVSTRTFFNYFPSKESAVIGADPDKIARIQQKLLDRPIDEPPLVALRAVLVDYAATIAEELDDLGEGRESWFRRFCVVREDPDLLGAYVAHIAEIERRIVETLAFRLGTDPSSDPYPALIAATVLAAVRVAGLHWSTNDGSDSLSRLTGAAIDSLAAGLVDASAFALPPAEPAPNGLDRPRSSASHVPNSNEER
jgi:AcrR family transcriptional regulator